MLPALSTEAGVDAWVVGNFVLSTATLMLVASFANHFFFAALVIYGLLRVWEVSVYQVNVLLFGEYRAFSNGKDYALVGYRRLVILLLHNYAEIILWMAATYTFLSADYVHKWGDGAGTAIGGFCSSFITMTTFGDFDLSPKNQMAAIVLVFHATVGLFMTLLSLARFIALTPPAKDQRP
jgi:hypothetical protein